MYDKLTQDMYNIKRQIRDNPDDIQLKDDLNEVIRQRNDIKKKMDELMSKIN